MFLDVKATYGATGNGTTDDRAAFVAADAAPGTIYVPEGTYRIASDVTLTSDIRFEQGAVLKPDPNVVVTLNGGLDARAVPVFQVVFDPTTHQPLGNVVPNRVDQLLPQWWGAKGDWSASNVTADDSPAIQAALAAAAATGSGGGTPGKVLFFPPGRYRVTKPLKAHDISIRGSGQFHSEILGATGRSCAIIEAVGAAFFTIEAISLTTVDRATSLTAPIPDASTIGILMARIINDDGNTGMSWYVDMREVSIVLHSDPTIPVPASGVFPARTRGTIGVYNYCVEISGCTGAFIRGDTGWVFTAGNYYVLTSFYHPGTGPGSMFQGSGSMTACSITGNNSLLGITGPALLLAGGGNLYVQAYLANQAAVFGATPSEYAIEVVAVLTDFEFLGSVEQYARVLRTYAAIRGMRLHAYSAYSLTDPRILLDAPPSYLLSSSLASIEDSEIDVIPDPLSYDDSPAPAPVTGYLIDSSPVSETAVTSNLIRLRYGKIWVRSGHMTGNLILTANKLADVSVTSPDPQANVIVAADGTQVNGIVIDGSTANGVRLASGTLGVANSAAATTPGSVVRKIEVFDAAGASLGFVAVYDRIS